jgi:hypothetical protein
VLEFAAVILLWATLTAVAWWDEKRGVDRWGGEG